MSNRTVVVRETLVFDVLGTLVDQRGSLFRQMTSVLATDEDATNLALSSWLAHVEAQQEEIVSGRRAFAPSDALDREALNELATQWPFKPGRTLLELYAAGEWLTPWHDTVEGVNRFAYDMTVVGLSNASRRALTGLSSHSGMRWHQIISGEDIQSYKPAARIYEAAIASVPSDSGVPIMVAAHAWDLRAAAKAGMRTAYVPRPNGDSPTAKDDFTFYAEDLHDLYRQLHAAAPSAGQAKLPDGRVMP